jgi:hypothetical protein
MAEMVRMRPGALVWNQGEEFVDSDKAHPKEIRAPPIKELTKSLSILIRAFLAPMRETSSVVWAGVNASMFWQIYDFKLFLTDLGSKTRGLGLLVCRTRSQKNASQGTGKDPILMLANVGDSMAVIPRRRFHVRDSMPCR